MTATQRATFSPIGTLTLAVQGFYYVITGAWPVMHPSSFELVSGAQADYWLVVLMGVLGICVGLGLLWSLHQRTVIRSTWTLAIVAAVAFLVLDTWYVLGVVIPRIYMIDAVAQTIFIIGAIVGRREAR
jgi:asparagine N-glycosylation enzyme membrane subunit Stt3